MDEKTATAEDQILDANEAFYRALQSRDMEFMSSIWLHQDWVFCVHPGWKGVAGWDAVMQTWAGIFAGVHDLKIQLRQITLQLCGPIAWITCIEEITIRTGSAGATSLAQATNIYMKVDREWKMVHHHASPVPVAGNTPGTATVQ